MKIKIHAKLITFLIIFNGFMQLPLLTNGQGASINSNGNPADTSAMLDVSSTTQGVLLPRMTTSQRNAINLPATGLIIYNIDCNSFNYNAGTPSAPNWLPLNAIDLLATPETISGSSDVCSNLSGVTYSIIPVSGATLYNWSLPVGATITAGIGTSSITVSFGSNAGNVCVVASNDCGTSDASCKSISITPPPVINITNNTSGGGTEVTCSITPISVECTTGYSAYLWSGGNSTNTAANTWTSAGTYTVTVTSVNGCTATSSIVTTENTTAPTEYSVTGGGSYCSGGTGVAVGLNNSQ
ncbi:MAG: hypothetical protein HGB12_15130, partial [Bacteroidetes bacterium]|nr:hypothetical protein [Bacteroidota bacterium]